MIDSVLLEDFQRHGRLEITLGAGVTSLVGRTGAGKSTVLRACRLLALNRPSGNSGVRHGRKRLRVTWRVDGREVVRSKGENENLYVLDGQTLAAFGRGGVPERVEELLRLDRVNFQTQHEPHFWLSLSPPDLGRELDRVFGLDLVDEALSRSASLVRTATAALTAATERATECDRRLASLGWVPAHLAAVEEVRRASLTAKIERELELVLGTLVVAHEVALARASECPTLPDDAHVLAEEISRLGRQQESLDRSLTSWQEKQERRTTCETEMERLGALLEALSVETCPACGQTIPSG